MKINAFKTFFAACIAVFLTGCTKETVIVEHTETKTESTLHFVDLGLSVNWADANLGAGSLEEIGGYYAFGETEGKDDYRMETYKWAELVGRQYEFIKYNNKDGRSALESEDDAATKALGSKFRIPTLYEMEELVNECTWTWAQLNGVKGYKVESNVPGYEGRYIFIPATGTREGTDPAITGFEGYYLSRTLYETGPYRLAFSPKGIMVTVTSTRYHGFSIRPITEKPKKVVSDLKVFSKGFPVYEFTCKESAAHKKIFVETNSSEHGTIKGYNPYIICFNSNGDMLWNWVPLSNRTSASYANWTLFDVSSDGGVIDCFNAITGEDSEGTLHNPFVTKLDGSGKRVWGSEPNYDVPLYEFKGDFLSYAPIGSYTVCDNEGGAWVAAWNSPKDQDIIDGKICSEMVFVHLDKDGNKTFPEISLNNASGTSGQKGIVTRAQMYIGNDNTLFALVLYDTVSSISIAYYDLVIISAEGKLVSKKLLMKERSILGDIRARITKDGKGGAYITMDAVNEEDGGINHLYLYHVSADGTIDAKEIDLTPGSCTASIDVVHAIDPATGNIAVITMDNYPPGARDAKKQLYYMVLDAKGQKIVSDNGNPILLRKGEGKNNLSDNDLKAIYRPETGKIFVSYIYEGYMALPEMRSFNVDFAGNASEDTTLFHIDRNCYGNIDPESQIYDFVNGNLLYFFRPNSGRMETDEFYGYVLKP